MPKVFDREDEPNDFMEMPCRCDCGKWFDLNDGYTSERDRNKVICGSCGEAEEKETQREDEIQEWKNLLENAKVDIKQAERELKILGVETNPPPPASLKDEAARLYPYDATLEAGTSEWGVDQELTDMQRLAHITCAGMYTDTIDKLKAELEQSLLLYNNQTATIFKLEAENSKMRTALEDGWVRVEDRLPGFKEPIRIPRAGQYPFVVIDVIDHNQYLVYTTCEVFELANFEKDGTWSFNNAEDEKVTHWRPLPALPIATEALKTT